RSQPNSWTGLAVLRGERWRSIGRPPDPTTRSALRRWPGGAVRVEACGHDRRVNPRLRRAVHACLAPDRRAEPRAGGRELCRSVARGRRPAASRRAVWLVAARLAGRSARRDRRTGAELALIPGDSDDRDGVLPRPH